LRYYKELFGYFTDNEIGFGKTDDFGLDPGFQAGQFDLALLRLVLGMNPGEPAYEFAWDFLLRRHEQSLTKLSADWQVSVPSKDAVRKLNEAKQTIAGESFLKDTQAFVELYARRYFYLANHAIKRYDPNHLILGCRFGAPPPTYVLDAIKPMTDVISANNYQPILYERYDTVYQYTGLPLLIGEFSWNTDLYKKVPYPDENSSMNNPKDRMFKRGISTLCRMAQHPGIVGYTWYRWVQDTSTKDSFYDGIVNYGDSLEMHSGELKDVNSNLEKTRISFANNKWENSNIDNGEMTLFFNQLKPDWNHYLRLEFFDGKPKVNFYGWKMTGKVLKFTAKGDEISMKIEIEFDTSKGNNLVQKSSGIYETRLIRMCEKLYGSFTGKFEETQITGKVKAFYFSSNR